MKNGFGVQSIASRSAMLQNIGPAFNFVLSQRTFLQTVFSNFQQVFLVMRGREKLEFESEETIVDLSQCWDAPKDLKMP